MRLPRTVLYYGGVTIKLYEARSPKIEDAPKAGEEHFQPSAWPPPLPPQPFADSEAGYDVKTEAPYASARGRYNDPRATQMRYPDPDPRPFEAPTESTMQQDPDGYESRWGKADDGHATATSKPFTIKK